MSTGYIATKDLHSEEVKVRLKEIPHAELLLIAEQSDIPPAVLARQLIMDGMRRLKQLQQQQQQQTYGNSQSA